VRIAILVILPTLVKLVRENSNIGRRERRMREGAIRDIYCEISDASDTNNIEILGYWEYL
jgi:hypothetical protein